MRKSGVARRFMISSALAILMLAVLTAASPAADLVRSRELINDSQRYDGKVVRYRGEVIGDVIDRGDFAWINVNDDAYWENPLRETGVLQGTNSGIGVHCSSSQAKEIENLGSYRALGDTVEVVGTFYEASPDHGGDKCIVASHLEVVRRGREIRNTDYGAEPYLAIGLGIVAAILGFLVFLRSKGESFSEE